MTRSGHAIRDGIGAALRAERQRQRVSLDAVARGTLVRQDFLELIDADRLEELPAGAYAKGFLRSYVAYLGLDPKPFLEAYEQRCGRPEPELSPLVQRGVRVPPARQRRAWQIAIGSTACLIVLLAVFGAFRSGEEPAEITDASTTAARVSPTTVPNTTSAVVRLEVIADETWVEAEVDGQPVFGDVLQRGEFETFKAEDSVKLYVTRASSVRIIANGKILGTLDDGEYRGVFTRDTATLPENTAGMTEEAPQADATTEPADLPAGEAADPAATG
jgi:hypothetical protein